MNLTPRQSAQARADSILAALRLPDRAALHLRDQQLTAMRNLVFRLTHSLNNSLAPLAGYITLLGEEVGPGTPGAQYLTRLEGSVRKAQVLIEAVVQATYPERQFHPRTQNFTALVRRVADHWLKALPAHAQVALDLELAECELCLDERLWEKVLEALLKNAEMAVGRAGSVSVVLERQSLEEAEAEALGLEGREACFLAIHDSGCGLAPEVRERACEPLYSAWAQAPGQGLGLTLVQSVVRLHGGQLALDSAEGLGTSVRIWLPDVAR